MTKENLFKRSLNTNYSISQYVRLFKKEQDSNQTHRLSHKLSTYRSEAIYLIYLRLNNELIRKKKLKKFDSLLFDKMLIKLKKICLKANLTEDEIKLVTRLFVR
jgi:hypothetical protein